MEDPDTFLPGLYALRVHSYYSTMDHRNNGVRNISVYEDIIHSFTYTCTRNKRLWKTTEHVRAAVGEKRNENAKQKNVHKHSSQLLVMQ